MTETECSSTIRPPCVTICSPPSKRCKRRKVYQIDNWEAMASAVGFSGSSLARECGVSLRHLQRHFQSAYGLQLQTWLNALRLSVAFTMLLRSESVKAVAYNLGFKQPSHFSREFKKVFGLSPREASIRYANTLPLFLHGDGGKPRGRVGSRPLSR